MKKQLLFGLSMFFAVLLNAQTGGWERIIASDDNEVVNGEAVYEAPSGDLLVAYTIAQGGQLHFDSSSIAMAWFDPDGQLLSQHTLPNEGFFLRTVFDILPSSDGQLYLVGTQRELEEEEISPDNELQLLILKVDLNGQILWSVAYDDRSYTVKKAILSEAGNIIVTGHSENTSTSYMEPFFLKTNPAGALLSFNVLEENTENVFVDDASLFEAEYLIISSFSSSDNLIFFKVDLNGNVIQKAINNPPPFHFYNSARKIHVGEDGGILMVSELNDFTAPGAATLVTDRLVKFDSDLNFEWEYDIHESYVGDGGTYQKDAICRLPNGNFGVLNTANYDYSHPDSTDFSIRYFMEVTSEGLIVRQQSNDFDIKIETYERMIPLAGGGFFATGTSYVSPIGTPILERSALVLKLNADGLSITNQINGNIRYDQNVDCLEDETEMPLKHWYVEATNGNITYYGQSDENGLFEIGVGSGTYEVTAFPPSDLWSLCEMSFTTPELSAYDTVSSNFIVQAVVVCPAMNVDLAIPFIRNCAFNSYQVKYCNYGTIEATEAHVEVTMPPGISISEAGLPYEDLGNGTYSFAVGTVDIGDCGEFAIEFYVDCEEIETGQTLCTEARIFPDTICTVGGLWSGASIEVGGSCINGDSLRFTIRNIGSAATIDALDYVIVEDQVIMMQDVFNLPPNDSIVLTLESTGVTFRLEAEQAPNHPGNSMPSISIEGCGGLHPGMVNLYALDDADLSIDIDCKQVVASFDPNDKTGFPLGYDDENFIEKNADLEYLIRFQNTGTDTAFRVVLRDTLSEFLNVASVRPGASSHPYTFEVTEAGILKFTYENILLPDSTTNLEASNGFVEFKVKQKENNPIGTQIYNQAAIYFDFNEPVLTNETKHTIGEAIFTDVRDIVHSAPVASVSNYPNPFASETTIDIGTDKFDSGVFMVFDNDGKLVREQTFTNATFNFQRQNLRSGTYHFLIQLDGQPRYNGKLIIMK